jgi:hypothetical protein
MHRRLKLSAAAILAAGLFACLPFAGGSASASPRPPTTVTPAAPGDGVLYPSDYENGIPVYLVPNGGQIWDLSGIHNCENISVSPDPYDIGATICADMSAEANGGQYYVTPASEGFCQYTASGTIIQCDAIDLDVYLYSPASSGVQAQAFYESGCGSDFGYPVLCSSSGRNYFPGWTYVGSGTLPVEAGAYNSCQEFWTVIEPPSSIVIGAPYHTKQSLKANFGSQHAIVCPQ